jgi:hypothetical protein
MGGTRATAMQSIQVHLSGAARSWMKKLQEGSIDSWETFEDFFVKNFRSTCKKTSVNRAVKDVQAKTGRNYESVYPALEHHQKFG